MKKSTSIKRQDRKVSVNKILSLCALLLFCCFSASAQLHAYFGATPVSGCAPLVVQFTDSSQGNPQSWQWDLGNGTTSFLKDPATTYFKPGTFAVKLVVKNALGIDSIVKTNYITVYAAPEIDFSGSPLMGCFPLTTQFTDIGNAGSGSIVKWEWDFGDGNSSLVQNPVHTYTAAGDYNVSLRATNSFGCLDSKTIPSYIKISSGTKAQFSNSVPNSCEAPATINFINESSGVGALSYQWNFGDGGSSTQGNPSHTYTSEGNYNVSLIVINATGCSDTIIKPGLINIGNTIADFEIPGAICEATPINFKNTSMPTPGSAFWDFGDGTFSNEANPSKTFTSAGSYEVKMIGNFGACKDSVIKTVTVIPGPVPLFTGTPTSFCQSPLTVNFTNNSTGGNSWLWTFGDGNTSTESNPVHTYLNEGVYTVALTVTNAAGCKKSLVKTDYINVKKPQVEITGLPRMGCVPLTHTFQSTINGDAIVNYQWNFGDGNSSTVSVPTHIYTIPGNYHVTLTYTTASGCTDSVRVADGILAGSIPDANFSANPLNTCAETFVEFTNLSTGGANEWYWSFGDGATSELEEPMHQYNDTGNFTVTLIAIHNGCRDTLVLPDYIYIKPPVARFTAAQNCIERGTVVFTDFSIGADTWQWDFGDGSSSADQNPTHHYSLPGAYTVTLTVTNEETGCSYIRESLVQVINEKADFKTIDSAVCKNTPIIFTAINSIPDNVQEYQWRFGDGGEISGFSNTISYAYTNIGAYNVTLIITDNNGCIDSVTKPLDIQVDGPTAAFTITENSPCLNSEVNFSDSSYTDGVHEINEWKWDWGDHSSKVFTEPPFRHTYTDPGNYTVSLQVTDNKGCTDTRIKYNAIIVSDPGASFFADTISCAVTPVQFYNSSYGPSLSYLWDFGDGNTSTQLNPVHLYKEEGRYTVSLTITDGYGCTNVLSKQGYIRIADPVANFLVSDSVTTCPPLVVNFTNTSQNYFTWEWNFGDGTTSLARNPSHFYASAGVFNAQLKIAGPGGCTSLVSKTIRVNGPSGNFDYKNISGCSPIHTSFTARTNKNTSFIWDFDDGITLPTADSLIGHTYTIPGKYVPKMILVDAGGCRVAITGGDTITVLGVEAGYTHNGQVLCDSGRVQFSAINNGNDEIINYLWDFGDGTRAVTKDPIHTYSKPGIYNTTLNVISRQGCRDTLLNSIPVTISRSPEINIGSGNEICVPGPLAFSGIINRPDTSTILWNWDFANGNASTQQNPLAQNYPVAGTFTISAIGTNSHGCKDSVQKAIEIHPLPKLIISEDDVVCLSEPKALNISGAKNYIWSPSVFLSCTQCDDPVALPDSSTRYRVQGISDKGCSSFDSVYLKVMLPFVVQATGPDTLCIGSSVQLNASGSELYSWTPAISLSNPSISSPIASPGESVIYRVIGADTEGCFTDTAFVPIEVYPIPLVNAGGDITINVGKQATIIPEISNDVSSVTWSPSIDIVSSNYPGIISRPTQTIEYTVTAKNNGGCTTSDRVSIFVLCNNANIFIPNTFSPNGDGANEIFYPRGTGVFTIKNLRIYNRWGEVVFENSYFQANDAFAGWDGAYKGQKLPPDVFIYTMDVVCENNENLIYKGNVTLIK